MKKIIALAIPLLVLVGTAVLFITLESRRMPDWELELNEYLARPDAFAVQQVVLARHPENFKPDMGAPVQGDWPWGIEVLPYPPQALRCVLLAQPDAAKQQTVYVGYYSDALWRSGWLVHEGPEAPFSPTLDGHLTAIGCDLELD